MRPTVLEKINPFIKVVTILVCGILMALTSSWKLNLAVLIAALLALLLLSNCKLSSLVKTFVPVILLAGAVFVSGMSYGKSAAQSASIYERGFRWDSALLLTTQHSRPMSVWVWCSRFLQTKKNLLCRSCIRRTSSRNLRTACWRQLILSRRCAANGMR